MLHWTQPGSESTGRHARFELGVEREELRGSESELRLDRRAAVAAHDRVPARATIRPRSWLLVSRAHALAGSGRVQDHQAYTRIRRQLRARVRRVVVVEREQCWIHAPGSRESIARVRGGSIGGRDVVVETTAGRDRARCEVIGGRVVCGTRDIVWRGGRCREGGKCRSVQSHGGLAVRDSGSCSPAIERRVGHN